MFERDPKKLIREKEKQMSEAVKILDFETAAIVRDEIAELLKLTKKKETKAKKDAKNKMEEERWRWVVWTVSREARGSYASGFYSAQFALCEYVRYYWETIKNLYLTLWTPPGEVSHSGKK